MLYNDTPRQSVFEYIESVECGLVKFRLLSLFGGTNGFLEQIRIGNNIAAPVPEIRMEHSERPDVLYQTEESHLAYDRLVNA
jgi:hypothetical protein